MRTEIDKDFRIERHKEYTIIWTFRTYVDEEDKEEKKTELEKEYELVEVNWYKAPRYKWKEIDSIIRYSRQCIKRWFPYLYQDKKD